MGATEKMPDRVWIKVKKKELCRGNNLYGSEIFTCKMGDDFTEYVRADAVQADAPVQCDGK